MTNLQRRIHQKFAMPIHHPEGEHEWMILAPESKLVAFILAENKRAVREALSHVLPSAKRPSAQGGIGGAAKEKICEHIWIRRWFLGARNCAKCGVTHPDDYWGCAGENF